MATATLEKRVRALEEKVKDLDAAARARAKLRKLILDGINSGPGIPMDEAYWRRKRALIRKRRSTV